MSLSQNTFVANAATAESSRGWFVVDAAGKPLGRLASEIARVLRGKHKPTYTPHVDTGDHVVVVNADKVKLTGQKLDKKFWYRHSAIPGGFKAVPYRVVLESKPTFPIEKAVKGMLPHNALGRVMIKKLHCYAAPDHPHAAQKPQPLNPKI
jgi:large subunit ribosomal protein L13